MKAHCSLGGGMPTLSYNLFKDWFMEAIYVSLADNVAYKVATYALKGLSISILASKVAIFAMLSPVNNELSNINILT